MEGWALAVYLTHVAKVFIVFSLVAPLRSLVGPVAIASLSAGAALLLAKCAEYPAAEASAGAIAIYAGKGIFEAVLIAAPIALLIEALPIAGRLADCFRGAQFAEQVAPQSEGRVSQLEQVGSLLSLILLFRYSLPERMIAGLIQAPAFGAGDLVPAFAAAFRVGLLAAAPVLVTVVVVEIGAALVSPLLAGFSVFIEFAALRVMIGLAAFAFVVLFSDRGLSGMFRDVAFELKALPVDSGGAR